MSGGPYDLEIAANGSVRGLSDRGRGILADLGLNDPALRLTFTWPHWHLSDPALSTLPVVVRPGGGRHRADSITDDLTVENVARYHAHCDLVARTQYVSHLIGTVGRHACRCDTCIVQDAIDHVLTEAFR